MKKKTLTEKSKYVISLLFFFVSPLNNRLKNPSMKLAYDFLLEALITGLKTQVWN